MKLAVNGENNALRLRNLSSAPTEGYDTTVTPVGTGHGVLYIRGNKTYMKTTAGTEIELGSASDFLKLDGSTPMTGELQTGAFSLLMTEQGSDPSTPASGKWKLYTKAAGLFIKDDAGAVTGPIGTGASAALDDLTDVIITTPANGEVLTYNGSEWVNGAAAGGSGDLDHWAINDADQITLPGASGPFDNLAFTANSVIFGTGGTDQILVPAGYDGRYLVTVAVQFEVTEAVPALAQRVSFNIRLNTSPSNRTFIGYINGVDTATAIISISASVTIALAEGDVLDIDPHINVGTEDVQATLLYFDGIRLTNTA